MRDRRTPLTEAWDGIAYIWRPAWVAELNHVPYTTQSFSRTWVHYEKFDFLEKIPDAWPGAAIEDNGELVVVRNPQVFRYFEFGFIFPKERDMRMESLLVRGLNELGGLWILGHSGEIMSCRLKPANGSSVSRDARKAAKMLRKRFEIHSVEE